MELPIFNTDINSSRHHFYCFTVVPLFVLDKLEQSMVLKEVNAVLQ